MYRLILSSGESSAFFHQQMPQHSLIHKTQKCAPPWLLSWTGQSIEQHTCGPDNMRSLEAASHSDTFCLGVVAVDVMVKNAVIDKEGCQYLREPWVNPTLLAAMCLRG